jgi:hypothetical protein
LIVIADDTPKRSQRTGDSSLTPVQRLGDKQMKVLTGHMENATAYGN